MVGMNNTEVEIKFPLLNHKELIAKLNRLAKVKEKDEFQRDTYYVPPDRDFLSAKPVVEWLRIRETNNSSTINYKDWQHKKNDQKTVFCKEYEAGLNNPESMKKIFQYLNFIEVT